LRDFYVVVLFYFSSKEPAFFSFAAVAFFDICVAAPFGASFAFDGAVWPFCLADGGMFVKSDAFSLCRAGVCGDL
jgi:hypothetical protein